MPVQPIVNKCPVAVTGCGHVRLAVDPQQLLLVVAHRYCMGGVHLKSKLKYTKRAGVVARWLLHRDLYVTQYYSECYNRDFQVHNLENYLK